jgi:hypothetical protein
LIYGPAEFFWTAIANLCNVDDGNQHSGNVLGDFGRGLS